MKKPEGLLQRITAQADRIPLTPVSIVEIAGDRRVLIEKHSGVRAYTRETILVNVDFGYVCVCGCDLEITRMSAEQLVIQGRVDGISLRRRN